MALHFYRNILRVKRINRGARIAVSRAVGTEPHKFSVGNYFIARSRRQADFAHLFFAKVQNERKRAIHLIFLPFRPHGRFNFFDHSLTF